MWSVLISLFGCDNGVSPRSTGIQSLEPRTSDGMILFNYIASNSLVTLSSHDSRQQLSINISRGSSRRYFNTKHGLMRFVCTPFVTHSGDKLNCVCFVRFSMPFCVTLPTPLILTSVRIILLEMSDVIIRSSANTGGFCSSNSPRLQSAPISDFCFICMYPNSMSHLVQSRVA